MFKTFFFEELALVELLLDLIINPLLLNLEVTQFRFD
jgi:hypothetical protein